ncbi:MAG: Arginine-tRNA ligase [Candidatus Woesebacteria bacterium GW2011_GWB1_39_10]|nr:MAG: Arginine-tRNA ligase [Candidatus Woesebacteria bacterium GW2011_GWB1_39_10]KKR92412.1 MAG: Arginine-tRNA ligase [Candidatus Woesebacteria bacterium GW2011_GWA1_41_13b]
MKFKIEKEVFDKFPNLVVALPIILDFDNNKSSVESLKYLRGQETDLRANLDLDSLVKDKRVAIYIDAFKKFGVDPEVFLPAHVALAKRVLEGGELPDINPLVNIYNALSIKYLTPFGGEDLNSLYGDFVLKFAEGGEQWIPIGGTKSRPAVKGELIWRDDLDLSTRALNWRQCDRTKLTKNSKNGYFIMDGFSNVNRENIEKAATKFLDLVNKHFGGDGKIYWLDKEHPEVEIPFESKKISQNNLKQKRESKPIKIVKKEHFGYAKIIAGIINQTLGIDNADVEFAENSEFGDYSCNVALVLAKSEGKNPRELAEEIRIKLSKSPELSKFVDKIEVDGPGFINFWLKTDVLVSNLMQIEEEKEKYGQSDFLKGKKVVVEYTDPNPFKEFHIGHLYTNTVGESISRLQSAIGASVWRADYFGDVGMHAAKAIWGLMFKFSEDKVDIKDLTEKPLKERIEYFGQAYAKGATAFEENAAAAEDMKELNFLIFKAAQEVVLPEFNESPQVNYDQYIKKDGKYSYSEIKNIYEIGRAWSLEYFESIYKRVGMKFDGYYPESRTGEFGYGMVLDGLAKGIFEKGERGAVIFPGEKYGLHNRVFINALNLPTYETKDFGNAVAKYKDFPYDKSIIVTGNEIDAYFDVVLKALFMYKKDLSEATTHIGHGMVRLPEGKMSSRTGKIIRGEWVLDEARKKLLDAHDMEDEIAEQVALGAVKYAFLKQGIGGDIAFDFESSLSLEGNSGPYLQYTVARCNSVIQKAPTFKDTVLQGAYSNLNEEELSVLRSLPRFSEVISIAAKTYSPNLLCNYLYDLASKFNTFYAHNRIISEEGKTKNEEVGNFRLTLTAGTGQVLKNGLNLLGIQSPERM